MWRLASLLGSGARRRRHTIALLAVAPRAMIDPESGLIFLWSARSACTFATAWFFAVTGRRRGEGRLAAPHALRRRRFVDTERYVVSAARTLRRRESRRGPVVKLVRDPFDRTLSLYFHVITKPKILAALARESGRALTAERLSFRGFLAALAALELDRCNPHFRPQFHPVERAGLLAPDMLLRVEEGLEAGLTAAAERCGLRPVDFAAERHLFAAAEGHRTERRALGRFAGDEVFADCMTPGFAAPLTEEFYDARAAAAVVRLYGDDFTAYGYDPRRFG